MSQQFLHYDMDVSDIDFSREYELINKGYGEDLFNNRYKFKFYDLDSLPQIFSVIYHYCRTLLCDSLSVGILGINRLDIEPMYN